MVKVARRQPGSTLFPYTTLFRSTNDAPLITSAAQSGAVSEGDDGASQSASGQVTFSDVDTSDTHIFSLSSAAAYGSASVAQDGSWHYTVSDAGAGDELAAGETLSDTFTVKVADSQGGFASQDVKITITGTNVSPLITPAAQSGAVFPYTARFRSSASGQVTFSDVDTSDTHIFLLSSAAAYGSASVAQDGSWHYTVSDAGAVDALAAGETLSEIGRASCRERVEGSAGEDG